MKSSRSGWRPLSCGVAVVLCASAVAARGEAPEPLGEADAAVVPSERATVVLREPLELDEELRERVVRAVTGELAELRARVEWVTPVEAVRSRDAVVEADTWARRHRAAAVVWLEVSKRGWRVFLYEARGPHLRQRWIRAEPEDAAVEELAVVLRSALTAILEGIEAGMSEVVLQPPPAAPTGIDSTSRSPPSPAEPWLALTGGYTGSAYARGVPWQNGGFLSVQLRPERGSVYLAASYAVLTPLVVTRDVSGAEVETRVRRRPVELFSGIEVGGGALRWGPEVGLIADYVERESLGVEEPFLGTATSGRWQIAGGGRLRGTWLLGDGLGVTSSVGADFLLSPLRHVVEVEGRTVALLPQMPIRPRLELGVFVRLW